MAAIDREAALKDIQAILNRIAIGKDDKTVKVAVDHDVRIIGTRLHAVGTRSPDTRFAIAILDIDELTEIGDKRIDRREILTHDDGVILVARGNRDRNQPCEEKQKIFQFVHYYIVLASKNTKKTITLQDSSVFYCFL